MKTALVTTCISGENSPVAIESVSRTVTSALASLPQLKAYLVIQGDKHADEIKETFKSHNNSMEYVVLDDKPGEPKAQNKGIGYALQDGADLIFSSNNDIEFVKDAIPRMLKSWQYCEDTDGTPGMMGPLTNNAWSKYEQVQFDPSFCKDKVDIVGYVNGFCFLTSAKVLKSLNSRFGYFFDPKFPPAAGLDDDFNGRVKALGYCCFVDRGAFVKHYRSTTVKAMRFDIDKAKNKSVALLAWKYHQYHTSIYDAIAYSPDDQSRLCEIISVTDPILPDYSDPEDYKIGQEK
jgi:GT2 family glycosyltransferase